jgi:signal transduction histidine kinase
MLPLLAGMGTLRAEPKKNILFLNSYRAGYIWTDELVRGTVERLEAAGDFEVWVEYMDARRNPGPDMFSQFEQRLAATQGARRFDLVITTDDEALLFMLDKGQKLFPGVPCVFGGVPEALAEQVPRNQYTGVIEEFALHRSFAGFFELHPKARELYAIVDGSSFGANFRSEIRKEMTHFPNRTFHILDTSSDTLADLATRLSGLPRTSIIVICSATRDKTRDYIPGSESIRILSERASAPVYTFFDPRQIPGVLAASVSGGNVHADFIFRQATRVLGGEKPEAVPLLRDDFVEFVFNYPEMKRWGLDPDQVPAPWRVSGRPVSFYEEYKARIWFGAGIVLLQSVIITGLIITVRQKRRAESRLQSALGGANAATEAKSRFLANVSHELRTPLNGILGMAQLMKGTSMSPEQSEYVGLLSKSTETLVGIVDDLLDLTQVEGGRMRVVISPYSPVQEVRSLLTLLEGRADDRRSINQSVVLEARLGPMLPAHVLGDPRRLRQILANLITNALKFTQHGRIEVAVSAMNGYPVNPFLRFEVTDTGVGIRPEDQARIFERFTQVDDSPTRRVGGAGLGLAICKHLVELMGGRIGVESKLGQGSTFWFELPLPPAGPEHTPDRIAALSPGVTGPSL